MDCYQYMHTCIHRYIHTCRHADMQTYRHTCMPACVLACMHAYLHIMMKSHAVYMFVLAVDPPKFARQPKPNPWSIFESIWLVWLVLGELDNPPGCFLEDLISWDRLRWLWSSNVAILAISQIRVINSLVNIMFLQAWEAPKFLISKFQLIVRFGNSQ